ncbi:hypothetical protein F5Y08DRAFT_333250 [Xylaria arbuscula]|nr:hypothetical protein F5Y08DRAFT_333250 [Xylaria arbuscula]
MEIVKCNDLFNVTSQIDIDQGPLSNCSGVDVINIEGETDKILTFKHLRGAKTIITLTTSRLETLKFPHLSNIQSMRIDRAPSLTRVSLPSVSADSLTLWITEAISLTDFIIGNSTSFASLTLSNVASSHWSSSHTFASPNISTVGSISLDVCLPLDGLRSAKSMSISCPSFCSYNLTNLVSVGGLTLEKAAFINTVDPVDLGSGSISPVQVMNSMTLRNSIAGSDPSIGGVEIPLRRIGSIVQDLNITSNGNVQVAYDGLTDVGGSLYIENNWNCSFNFDKLSTVGNILFTNNSHTGLPLFPNLTTVGDIYIGGAISTPNGANIFPALTLVSGNVTIEATNNDFNCSKLVSQFTEGSTRNVKCNGKNYNISKSLPEPSHGSNQGLSREAWAGIGVGTAVAVIGILGVFIGIIIHYRRRLTRLEKGVAVQTSSGKRSINGPRQQQPFTMQEVDGRGIFREKPDDPLVELLVEPSELPTGP